MAVLSCVRISRTSLRVATCEAHAKGLRNRAIWLLCLHATLEAFGSIAPWLDLNCAPKQTNPKTNTPKRAKPSTHQSSSVAEVEVGCFVAEGPANLQVFDSIAWVLALVEKP